MHFARTNSGHLRLCQQPRAAHALRSDQKKLTRTPEHKPQCPSTAPPLSWMACKFCVQCRSLSLTLVYQSYTYITGSCYSSLLMLQFWQKDSWIPFHIYHNNVNFSDFSATRIFSLSMCLISKWSSITFWLQNHKSHIFIDWREFLVCFILCCSSIRASSSFRYSHFRRWNHGVL
jgi:hypothetical protein